MIPNRTRLGCSSNAIDDHQSASIGAFSCPQLHCLESERRCSPESLTLWTFPPLLLTVITRKSQQPLWLALPACLRTRTVTNHKYDMAGGDSWPFDRDAGMRVRNHCHKPGEQIPESESNTHNPSPNNLPALGEHRCRRQLQLNSLGWRHAGRVFCKPQRDIIP